MSKSDGLNPYAYVGGNPVNAIDPNGLCAWRMVGGIADIGVGLLLTAKTGGIGLVVAWGIIINGADNLVAGAYSMIAGEEIPSLIQGGFRRAIPNRTAADLAYMGFEIGLNVAGLAVERTATQVADELGEAVTQPIISVPFGKNRLLYSGRQQQRALAIAQEASQAAGVTLGNYVDDVVFTTGKNPFFSVINGRRVLALSRSTLRKTRAGQLIDAVHELSHARHVAKLGNHKYLNIYKASLANRGRIEILVESRAVRTVARYLGGLSPQQRGWSSRYISYWRQYYP